MLTCEGLDARALKQPGRAVVVVQLLVRQVEAGVDVAVLLRDLRIVEVRGGSHGGRQRSGRGGGRRRASSVSGELSLGQVERAGWGVNPGERRQQRGSAMAGKMSVESNLDIYGGWGGQKG